MRTSRTTVCLSATLVLVLGCATSPVSGLAVPDPLWPRAGSTFDHYPRSTELSWTAVPGASSYSIEVDCFHCCEIGKWCTQVGRRARIEASGIEATRYKFSWVGANLGRWRVWAVGRDGSAGEKSAWQDFLYTR